MELHFLICSIEVLCVRWVLYSEQHTWKTLTQDTVPKNSPILSAIIVIQTCSQSTSLCLPWSLHLSFSHPLAQVSCGLPLQVSFMFSPYLCTQHSYQHAQPNSVFYSLLQLLHLVCKNLSMLHFFSFTMFLLFMVPKSSSRSYFQTLSIFFHSFLIMSMFQLHIIR